MGNISRILGKAKLPKPNGWKPDQEQFNLPFTVELKENFHIHWQDIRIEMMPDDFDAFTEALWEARDEWYEDGCPKNLPVMKRYGYWEDEDYHFYRERDRQLNGRGEPCHHFRVFPRTESGKLHFDTVLQVEEQADHRYLHIHYKNFRWELGKGTFLKTAECLANAASRIRDSDR